MRYRILSEGQVIGESDLEGGDPAMGVASGHFHPAEAYEEVRGLFREYQQASETGDQHAIERCCRRRDELGLTLQEQDGRSIAVGWVHILDLTSTLGDSAYQVEIDILEPEFFRPCSR